MKYEVDVFAYQLITIIQYYEFRVFSLTVTIIYDLLSILGKRLFSVFAMQRNILGSTDNIVKVIYTYKTPFRMPSILFRLTCPSEF